MTPLIRSFADSAEWIGRLGCPENVSSRAYNKGGLRCLHPIESASFSGWLMAGRDVIEFREASLLLLK
jgi:hypothetical protein